MPFNIPSYEKKSFEKTNFLRLDQGTHIVRFLEPAENSLVVDTHYVMGKFTIQCPGEGCPICANNKQLVYNFPDNFRDQKGYSPRSVAYLTNVLDRTMVKICSCGAEVKAGGPKNTFPPTCPECNSFLHDVEPHPSNKVKVLKFGVQLATGLNTIEKATCDAEGNPLGLLNFDVALSVEGTRQKKVTTPIPITNKTDKLDVPQEMFQNLENAMIKLTPEEIGELLNGVSLKDIFTARRTSQKIAEIKATVESNPVAGDMLEMQKKIEDLLN